ncbi:NAD(P)H-hydrate dehydratase [Hydromonas duriensis]|uniref:Bifunctional NAD(P)H-hydrate repair enzyme n=1 Tax=Hydromonas duriensis TaxID=1527608 RepID=A0A4R6Y1Q5_9BURK|nr:NAD(P)H-hydrate dehydratase [Hydromonas duriensis]TDR29086.1 hydroxyethylthiazole kinase-like uncharacterized protein yjeF/hydroxyethylthiazole kinase-like uncharacterized protein yjeF [Hydromonas duriensis]
MSPSLHQTISILDVPALRMIEQDAERDGVDLMALAALSIADRVSARYPSSSCVWIAAGVGNNGGDALFAAQILHQRGFHVQCMVMQPPVSRRTQAALAECETLNIPIVRDVALLHDLSQLKPAPNLIIDGLLGIGINRAPSDELAGLIAFLNQMNTPILALDVPSGLNAETGEALGEVIRATDTLTFIAQKSGLWMADGADCAGQVLLADLNVNKDAYQSTAGALNLEHDAARIKLKRPRNSHKGRFGSVAVVGGHVGMLGAALLAGRAALAAGAGKVWLNVLDERLAVDVFAPELMIRLANANLGDAHALAIGMGLGQDEAAQLALSHALGYHKASVLDADALNLIAHSPLSETYKTTLRTRTLPAVLTPHPTEAARLLKSSTLDVQANRVAAARRIAREFASVVVLKGAGTVIAHPNGAFKINTTGGSALAVAGQGDVLSGAIAALLGMDIAPFDAACLAVYMHGLAGDAYEAQANGSIGLSASATVPRISSVLNQWLL